MDDEQSPLQVCENWHPSRHLAVINRGNRATCRSARMLVYHYGILPLVARLLRRNENRSRATARTCFFHRSTATCTATVKHQHHHTHHSSAAGAGLRQHPRSRASSRSTPPLLVYSRPATPAAVRLLLSDAGPASGAPRCTRCCCAIDVTAPRAHGHGRGSLHSISRESSFPVWACWAKWCCPNA